MMTDEDLFGTRFAESLAAKLEGRGKSSYRGVLRMIGARVPVLTAARIQAMSKMSGTSMSDVIYHLIEAGIAQVDSNLSASGLKQLQDLHNEALDELGGDDHSGEI